MCVRLIVFYENPVCSVFRRGNPLRLPFPAAMRQELTGASPVTTSNL